MEIKVRALDSVEPKGVQEVEKELLEKHEEQQNDEATAAEEVKVETTAEVELKDEDVLSYISKRYNKQINSVDELFAQREAAEQLPEDVGAFLKYKKETGRGIEDFMRLQKDFDSMDENDLLRQYLLSTQEGVDESDVDVLMEDYSYDEDIDDESTIKKIKITKKKAVTQAKKYFNELKEQYKQPLESRQVGISKEEQEEFNAYRDYIKNAKTIEEENERKRGWFEKKTDEIFSKDFKGFDFSIDNKKFTYAPSDAAELKKIQSNPFNFINKYLDENGMIGDAAGYHKGLAIAMNPDKFAKFFYEQGMADGTDDVLKKTKNINMSERQTPEVINKGGVQIRAVGDNSGRSLRVKSIKPKQ
jgi:hypothetical protein